MLDAISDGDFKAIVDKIVEKAKAGDLTAAKMILDRVAPPPKSRAVPIDLAEVGRHDGKDAILKSISKIMRAAAIGEITPTEAIELAELVDKQRQAFADLDPNRMRSEEDAAEHADFQQRADDQITAISDRWLALR